MTPFSTDFLMLVHAELVSPFLIKYPPGADIVKHLELRTRTALAQSGFMEKFPVPDAAHTISQFASATITDGNPLLIKITRAQHMRDIATDASLIRQVENKRKRRKQCEPDS